MKVLDAGTEPMSNVDVLNWMKDKRKQHAEEDAADKKKGKKPSPRPENFMRSLKKHETALKSNDYPYTKNPTAYAGKDGAVDAMTKFDTMITEKICFSLEDKYRGKGMTIEELDKTLGKEQEEKSLTEPEHLMIMNLAPQCVEMLQPMIENVQDRFTAEEQQIIVDCIIECYRCDEVKAKAEGGEDEGVMVAGDEGVEEPAEDDAGAGATEMGQLEAGMR